MEKTNNRSFIINKVQLGDRLVGMEVFNAGVNGGEIVGYTAKQLTDAMNSGKSIYGMVVDGKGELVMDSKRGFTGLMIKTGVSNLTSTDPAAIANIMYTVYDRQGDSFKVISSRFGRLTFCADKIKALIDLQVVNGVIEDGEKLVCCWELDEVQSEVQEPTADKKKGA